MNSHNGSQAAEPKAPLAVQDFLTQLRDQQIDIQVDGDRLRVRAQSGVLTPEIKAELGARKQELLDHLRQAPGGTAQPLPLVQRPANLDFLPLSFAQQRLWFIEQLAPELGLYNIPSVLRLRGPLDAPALERSLATIVARHESLRTCFVAESGEPQQVIRPAAGFPLAVVDLIDRPAPERESRARELARAEVKRPFDLAADLMLRATLLRLAEDDHVLVMAMHHIASDGWSSGVFWRELRTLYAACLAGEEPDLPPLTVQYADYAVWQHEWLQGERLAEQVRYWREQLAGLSPLELPTDRPRPAVMAHGGASEQLTISAETVNRLRALCRREEVTPYMALLGLFDVLLYRYSGQADIAVGTPIAGRLHTELEPLIGFFVNTLVMRTDLGRNPTFRELLGRVQETALAAYDHQELPFEKLVEELQPERHLSRNPLFQVLFQLFSMASSERGLPGLTTERWSAETGTAKFDLELTLGETPEGITGGLRYSSELFEAETAQRMVGHFLTLLEGALADPDARIDSLPLLTDGERRQILEDWSAGLATETDIRSVVELFAAQAARTPDATAVSFEGATLSYAELDSRADRLAHVLVGLGVRPDVVVGICLPRSQELAVAVLAVLKAGGAYLPLDPAHPGPRLAFMLADARAPLVVSQRRLAGLFAGFSGQVLHLDEAGPWQGQAGRSPAAVVDPENLAYVMYTSGSTGQPKGVAMRHGSLANLIRWQVQHPILGRPARTLQFSALSFDVSFQELFSTWCTGGELVLVVDEVRQDLGALREVVKERRVERLFMPFIALQHLAELVAADTTGRYHLRQVVTAGEQLQVTEAIRRMLARLEGGTLHNHYGPTEAHVVSEYILAGEPAAWPTLSPIGRPIDHVRLYVLDGQLQPVPVGVPGDLYIGGVAPAAGYIHRPQLTAERFVPDPYSAAPGGRMYRTGDLARWQADGTLLFLGRRDSQVKVRGYRVELGEVEAVLAQHPAVSACAVVLREDRPGDQRLVAYWVAAEGDPGAAHGDAPGSPSPSSASADADLLRTLLRTHLRRTLPEYMAPAAFVRLAALPLSPNGKVDRAALPVPDQPSTGLVRSDDGRPRTPVEETLASIWAEVLNAPAVGIHDNFFELGGHSLLGIKLFARMEQELGQRLPLALLFQAPTVAQLAAQIKLPESNQAWQTLIPIRAEGSRPPFFCVHGFGGGVIGYADLAHLLPPEQPFYGLQAAGLDGHEPPDTSIQAMAARYVTAMRALQPSGPYYLGGYCLGGVIAFEMARQLEAAGEPVALLAVMEGSAPMRYHERASVLHPRRALAIWRNLPYWLDDYRQLGVAGLRRQARRKLRVWRKRALRRLGLAQETEPQDVVADDLSVVPQHHMELLRLHVRAMHAYEPQPYGGAVTLFVARGATVTKALFGSLDTASGWQKLARGGVQVRMVDGGHRNIHMQPNVPSLARELTCALQAAQTQLER